MRPWGYLNLTLILSNVFYNAWGTQDLFDTEIYLSSIAVYLD